MEIIQKPAGKLAVRFRNRMNENACQFSSFLKASVLINQSFTLTRFVLLAWYLCSLSLVGKRHESLMFTSLMRTSLALISLIRSH